MRDDSSVDSAVIGAIRHYLYQTGQLLNLVLRRPDAKELLAVRLAPDTFDTGFHFAVAIQFAARALCLPSGGPVPEIVEPYNEDSLRSLYKEVTQGIDPVTSLDWNEKLLHIAGEAQLEQVTADYVVRFAYPNMLFHFTQAYAGLRHAGLQIGKADFDGFHRY